MESTDVPPLARLPYAVEVTKNLFLGPSNARCEIHTHNIDLVISLLTTVERHDHEYIASVAPAEELSFIIDDTAFDDISKTLDQCLPAIRTALQKGLRVLVHCNAGRSRSPAVITAHFMLDHMNGSIPATMISAYAMLRAKCKKVDSSTFGLQVEKYVLRERIRRASSALAGIKDNPTLLQNEREAILQAMERLSELRDSFSKISALL